MGEEAHDSLLQDNWLLVTLSCCIKERQYQPGKHIVVLFLIISKAAAKVHCTICTSRFFCLIRHK